MIFGIVLNHGLVDSLDDFGTCRDGHTSHPRSPAKTNSRPVLSIFVQAMARTPYKGTVQGSYRVLIKGLPSCIYGVWTIAHLNPPCEFGVGAYREKEGSGWQ